jgi:pantothenate synthetase
MAGVIDNEPLLTLEYADVVAAGDLARMYPLAGEIRLLIAARLGRARLIDNLGARI